jgi:hypothetical protein
MIRHRAIFPIVMIAACLLLSMVMGCSSLNILNNDFLNTFMPLGQTSLSNIEGKGPVAIVLENLTVEARHGENAIITIRYIDENGNTQWLTPSNPLPAVAEDQRDPQGPNYDGSYKETFILDCGVREIWVTGVVYRRAIELTTETDQSNTVLSRDYTYCTASPNTTQSYIATQLPEAHLKESKHFKCGDVIVIGLLDGRLANGSGSWQTYACDYTNWASLSVETQAATGATPFSLLPSNIQLISDPVNQWMQLEYRYPTHYVLIPAALPNLAAVADALPMLIGIAVENAKN